MMMEFYVLDKNKMKLAGMEVLKYNVALTIGKVSLLPNIIRL